MSQLLTTLARSTYRVSQSSFRQNFFSNPSRQCLSTPLSRLCQFRCASSALASTEKRRLGVVNVDALATASGGIRCIGFQSSAKSFSTSQARFQDDEKNKAAATVSCRQSRKHPCWINDFEGWVLRLVHEKWPKRRFPEREFTYFGFGDLSSQDWRSLCFRLLRGSKTYY